MTEKDLLKIFKGLQKRHTFTLNSIYRDVLERMTQPSFLQGSLYKGVSKKLGISNVSKTMSFLNFFKAMELMRLKVTITYEIEDLDGKKITYVTDGTKLDIITGEKNKPTKEIKDDK